MYKKKFNIINSKEFKKGYFFSKKDMGIGDMACFIYGKKKKNKGIIAKEKTINQIKLDGGYISFSTNKMYLLDKLKRKEYRFKLLTGYKHREYIGLSKKGELKNLKLKFKFKYL
jgi:hypothetical protein